jgi:hypothetical protein
MLKISGEVFSHVGWKEVAPPKKGAGRQVSRISERSEWCSVARVRESQGYRVTSFRMLVSLVAELGYLNRSYNLLFRGQGGDFRDRNGRTVIYPTLHRPKRGHAQLRKATLEAREKALEAAVETLRRSRERLEVASPGLYKHREYQLALLQHYGIRKTPLVDATHSLRVATSFAMPDRSSGEGYLFVLGLPHAQGSISHFIDQDMVLVKLQNVCPPEALRPHYQEGYLLGRLSRTATKDAGDNAAYRVIAKYHLVNEAGAFWDADFQPLPTSALLPKDDPFEKILVDLVGPDPVD